MVKNKKVGLGLSGGGFRAAAFHLGVLKKLNELNILPSIDVISTISGGSIIGAYYTLFKNDLSQFFETFQVFLTKNVVLRAILSFSFIFRTLTILFSIIFISFIIGWWASLYSILLLILIACFFYVVFPTTTLVQRQYDKLLYNKKRLSDLPESPKLIINSTNLDTGTLFSFTKKYSFDSTYQYIKSISGKFNTERLNISTAVACSTAVPYLFSPTTLRFKTENGYVIPKLVDGGVYDNQGIYRLTGSDKELKSDIVIICDASSPFKKNFLGVNPIPVFSRVMNIMMRRIRNIQFVNQIYEHDETELFEIAYFSLEWDYENCLKGFINATKKNQIRPHLLTAHNITEDIINDTPRFLSYLKDKLDYERKIKNGLTANEINFVKNIGTNLTSLSKNEIELLSRHAEILTEIQVRLYCPSLIVLLD